MAAPESVPERARRPQPANRTRPPAGLLLPGLVGLGFLVLPLLGLLRHVPWSGLGTLLASPAVRVALLLSLRCSLGALALSVIVGVPLAWLLARVNFPGRTLVRALVTLPMVLPPVVGGVGLLYAFGRKGLLGPLLDQWGITLAFTTTGAVLAETFVALPFMVIAAEGGFRQISTGYEETAATLGASPWRQFTRVTLPLAAPSLAAGAALTWARALGEFGATITFAGNLEGTTQTMPLAVYVALQSDPDIAVVMALILLTVSVAVLLALRERWLNDRAG